MNAQNYINAYKSSASWKKMINTVEGSHWHREANVAVHTEMVIDYYLKNFAPSRSERENNIALIALLYHDIGKPVAEQTLFNENNQAYHRYSGHEQHSAVDFMQDYVRSQELRQLLNVNEARAVRFIIENHLPYGITRPEKRVALAVALREALRLANVSNETFYDCLRSDAAGRISDNHAEKLNNVEAWIQTFSQIEAVRRPKKDTTRNMYILVGPSGSGKTTWRARMSLLVNGIFGIRIMTPDELRVQYFEMMQEAIPNDQKLLYRRAWDYTTNDKQFDSWAAAMVDKQFKLADQNSCSVIVDMTNCGRKKRRVWVDRANRENLNVIIVEFWNTLETLVARQTLRDDKSIPDFAVAQQLSNFNTAWDGYECDHVIVEIGK